MNAPVSFDSAICVRLILTFAHFLWQGAAILVFALAAAALLRRSSANTRYAVLAAAMLLMAACPPVTFLIVDEDARGSVAPDRHARYEVTVDSGMPSHQGLQAPHERPAQGGSPAASGEAALHTPPALTRQTQQHAGASHDTPGADWTRYAPHAVLCYLLGAVAMFARLLLAVYGGQRLRRRSQPVEDGTILIAFSRQARALGLPFTPAIAFCRDVAVPTVVGVLRPMILLPLSLASGLTPEQVEVLLAHELAHIRRYDYFVNFLQRVVEAILFFHPAVWLISRRIRIERENCCDDMVLAAGGQRFAYAESLVRMAELSKRDSAGRQGIFSPPYAAAAALGADGQRSQLRNRIMRLIAGPASHERVRLKRTWTLVVCVLAVSALTLNCLVPPRQTDTSSPSAAASSASSEGSVGLPNAVPVRTPIDGIVAEAKVKNGQAVKKGDLLVQLDATRLRLDTEAAEKRSQDLRKLYERLDQEYRAGLRNELEPRKAATDMKLAEIELKRLALHMERTRVLSPVDGTVVAATQGNLLAPAKNTPLNLTGSHVAAGQVLLYVETAGRSLKPGPAAAQGNEVPVRAPADGVVADVKVEAGHTVKTGELLVQLDDREIRLDVEMAKERLQGLRRRSELLAAWSRAGLTTTLEAQKAAADVTPAEIELQRQELRLRNTRITSPADGTALAASQGSVVVPVRGAPLHLTGERVTAGQVLLYVAPPGTVPREMVGTWFFDNPEGDDEQMAVFPDGRVVVIYSNGHRDEPPIENGTIELAQYRNVRVRMSLPGDGTLIQTSDSWNGFAKRWRRIDPAPRTDLLRPLSGPPSTQPTGENRGTGAETNATRTAGASDLKQIGIGCVLYAETHKGELPADLRTLLNGSAFDKWPADKRSGESYVYLGNGRKNTDDPRNVIAYEKPEKYDHQGTNVLFLDAHVAWLPVEQLEQALRDTRERPRDTAAAPPSAKAAPDGGDAGSQPPTLIEAGFVEVTGEADKLDPAEVLKRLPPRTTLDEGLAVLRTLGAAEVIARPSVLVAWPQKATITIGEKMPIVSEVTTTPDGKVEPKITYINAGLTLDIQGQWFAESGTDRAKIDMHIRQVTTRPSGVGSASGIPLPMVISREWYRPVTVQEGVNTWVACSDPLPIEDADETPTKKRKGSLVLVRLTVQHASGSSATATQPAVAPARAEATSATQPSTGDVAPKPLRQSPAELQQRIADFEAQLATMQEKTAKLARKLATARTATADAITLEETIRTLSDESARLGTERAQYKAAYERLAQTTPTSFRLSPQMNAMIEQDPQVVMLRRKIEELEKVQKETTQRLNDDHPQVKTHREQLAGLRASLENRLAMKKAEVMEYEVQQAGTAYCNAAEAELALRQRMLELQAQLRQRLQNEEKRTKDFAPPRTTQPAGARTEHEGESDAGARSQGILNATVVIDAGHGGKDPGATGVSGVPEKTITLDIAQKLKHALADRVSRIVMTRSGDEFVELDGRAATAEKEKADVFVSIHAGSSRQNDSRGSTLYVSSHGSSESMEAARRVQAALADRAIKCNEIKIARLRVLVGHSRPAVMLEVGFMTNKDEAALLNDDGYRERLAEAIAAGITDAIAARQSVAGLRGATQPAGAAKAEAGAVRELQVNADAVGKDCVIDLDTGRLVTPPKDPEGGFPAWIKSQGLDAGCTVEKTSPGLWGFDMVVVPTTAEAWDRLSSDNGLWTTLRHHVETGTVGSPAVMSAAGPLPATYVFKTREGGVGILQIIGFNENPKGLKIRYRLLQQGR